MYPVPIIVPHANPRIAQQSGTFLAYNLYSHPINGTYDYLYLNNLQIQLLNEEPSFPHFLEKISISLGAKNKIKRQLEVNMNIKKEKYYPELPIIADEAKNHVKNQLKIT